MSNSPGSYGNHRGLALLGSTVSTELIVEVESECRSEAVLADETLPSLWRGRTDDFFRRSSPSRFLGQFLIHESDEQNCILMMLLELQMIQPWVTGSLEVNVFGTYFPDESIRAPFGCECVEGRNVFWEPRELIDSQQDVGHEDAATWARVGPGTSDGLTNWSLLGDDDKRKPGAGVLSVNANGRTQLRSAFYAEGPLSTQKDRFLRRRTVTCAVKSLPSFSCVIVNKSGDPSQHFVSTPVSELYKGLVFCEIAFILGAEKSFLLLSARCQFQQL
ncbi:hypothetical protein E5288_WYG007469 [Bos mutus]|uniref:Uncharacterized protein n=1 Tax=Bos mutus TaxID=72004 RepID=A0A6B0RDA2_9CETA|nr:hypothetical protein [Bos mutus]